MKKSPFKFLDSYSRNDRDIFFGRDKEIEELHSRVFQSRVLIVYGISGTGKSSLINCGLANKFNDSDWLPVHVRRGININQSLADNLSRNALTGISLKGSSKTDILKLMRSVYLDHFKPVFLIFDQFEEMFIFGTKSERDEFISIVRAIIDSDLQCRFIFSMREEYLAGFTEFEKVIPSFLDNRIRIEKMTRQNAMKAIEGPCRVNRIEVEQGVPETILQTLNPESPEVELTYLQVYLDKVFLTAQKEDADVQKITSAHIETAGDVKDLLGSFLEEQISRLDDPDKGLVILKSFVSVRGTKHQITEEEVIEYSHTLGKDFDSNTVRDMIQKFVGLRILRDKDEHGRYELRHDSLASAIYEKITLVEKELLEIRQFIENSWRNYEKRGLYLSVEDLSYIAPYEDKLFLSEKLSRFISGSKKIIQKAKRRRQNILVSFAAIIFIVLSFFTAWALRERKIAFAQKQYAEEQTKAALSAKNLADSATRVAIVSKELAVENEKLALEARELSDQARREAIAERENALQQKNRAEKLSEDFSDQARIANEEKHRAEMERLKALAAESEAKRLNALSQAQNYALSSINSEKSPSAMGEMAITAYNTNLANGGNRDNPVIFEALNKAWSSLDSSRHSVFRGSENEIRSIAGAQQGLITTDLEGEVITWDFGGQQNLKSVLGFSVPANFTAMDPSGRYILTQHDNLETILWKAGPGGKFVPLKLSDHTGYIYAAAFTPDGNFFATGGRDSLIVITDMQRAENAGMKFKTSSSVRSLLLCNSDSVFYACEDGTIALATMNGNTLIHSGEDKIPLSLAWNIKEKSLLTGFSDGSLFLFNLKDGRFREPLRFFTHEAGIDLMTFNHDFSLFATSSRDRTIKFYFFNEFFIKGNDVEGFIHLKYMNSRVRSMIFTGENKLVAGLSDRTIRIWETSAGKIVSLINEVLNDRDLRISEK